MRLCRLSGKIQTDTLLAIGTITHNCFSPYLCRMYKAVFTDMDGTLLRKDHTISDKTKTVIQNLISQGILIVPISARPLHGMLHITEKVFPEQTPVISLNGSYIYHNGEIIYEISMPLPATLAIDELVKDYPVSPMYYSRMDWFSHIHTDAIKKEQKITPVPITIQPFHQTIAAWKEQLTGPNKILIAGDEKTILAVEKKLLGQFDGTLNIYKSQPKYLEAMHPDASKASAINFFLDKYGLKKEEIVAIGDNYNDQSMLELAGLGVAMGNAPDEIKAMAGYVTDTNNNDGVAKALEHIFG